MGLRIGKVVGAPIIITWNLFVYIGVYCLFALFRSGVGSALNTLLAATFIASCVLLHEIGHALAGNHFGVRPVDIKLNFFGGMASNDPNDWRSLMDRPKQAIVVWLCGPLVNIFLDTVISLIMPLFAGHPTIYGDLAWARNVNFILAAFNLLPFYPLDGGGILYSVLRIYMSKAKAIRIASIVSMIGAVGLVLLAFKFHVFVAGLIAVFIFLAALHAPKSSTFMLTKRSI